MRWRKASRDWMRTRERSMVSPDRRRAALAPAYDFVSTIAFIADGVAALKFSRTKRSDEFSGVAAGKARVRYRA